ncbi:hypothetical protein AB0M02_33740 [Actinoplanes sp. NPDC051861]|uniref:hypothetical protein n=1 Tax=Actinoplanes sp. NPDC051861 TaxID=3155170 RepID=UPI0034146EBF
MRHPSDGTLRRLVDEPAGVADTDREHVAGCAVCLSALSETQRDAEFAGAALHHEVTPDADAAWLRLSGALAAGAPAPAVDRAPRWRARLSRPVIAAAAVVALLTGATAAAATDWLQIFRTEQIAPVTIRQADLLRLPDLSGYGDLTLTEPARIREVPDAATARSATGLSVPEVGELPRGVSGEPTFHTGARVSAEFTFSAEKAAASASAAGHTLPPVPPGLDGSRFRLTAGPGVAAVWSEDRGVPALFVGRAVAPTAYSSGVPFATARDYLLSLSGLPEDVASQLRQFSGDGRTLPVHVMAEELTSSTADVNGTPATVFASRDEVLAAVVWIAGGVVTAVAGPLSTDEVLTVARGLRWQR